MNGFGARMLTANEHEARVASSLRSLGYTVGPFGQGQLTPCVRDALKCWKTSIRWMPDLIVLSRTTPPFLVDAKAGRTDTSNWNIEAASHAAHVRLQDALDVEVLCVWSDMSWNRADDIAWGIETGVVQKGKYVGVGSATPFWLVPKWMSRHFDDLRLPDERVVHG